MGFVYKGFKVRAAVRVLVRPLILGSLALWALAAAAQPIGGLTTTNGFLRAKAVPDECFIAIGSNIPFSKPPCFLGQPKVNQGYVWAMTEANTNEIWYGTLSNGQCVTQGGLTPNANLLVPYRTDSWVCEFGKSSYVTLGLLPPFIGDFRPPQIFLYNETTQALTDMTPKVPVTQANPLGLDPRILVTLGIRAAATVGNLVLLSGPSLLGGLNFFAFQADTHAYLGSANLPGFSNIRQFLLYNGNLYTAVGTATGGAVLKWTGAVGPAPCQACFNFDVVGQLDGIGAYIAAHQGHIFVTTWPTGAANVVAGLFESPLVPDAGLTTDNASQWTKVWDVTNYEPDRVIASSYAGGALASFGGYLYWGTMHVPWSSLAVFLGVYGTPATTTDWTNAIVGSFRASSIFRGSNFDTAPNVSLLYGSPVFSVYRPPSTDQPGGWVVQSNNMPLGKQMPLYGLPGFWNPYNNYIWSMTVWDNRLWVGTMDWSYPAEQGANLLAEVANPNQPPPPSIGQFFAFDAFGGDLFFFESPDSPATAESNSGVGNYASYGIRNMLSSSSLFLGMANPSNLLTSTTGPQGGWELIELQKNPNNPPLTLLNGFSCAPLTITSPGTIQCTTSISSAAPAAGSGITVGVLGGSTGPSVTTPGLVNIPPSQTSITFPVQIAAAAQPTIAALVAGLNGGTEITSVAVTPPPANITASVQVTSSGILYSRVTQTFGATVTVTNTSTAPITAPIQLSCTKLPAGVSLTNATGSYVGAPFITALASGSLAPGQSIAVALKFKNSSTSAISFTPVVYSGPINF